MVLPLRVVENRSLNHLVPNSAPSLLRPDPHLAKALDRVAGAKIVQLEELPDLDLAFLAVDAGIGKAPRPFHRLFARFDLDDRVACDQLLRFGEGPVDHGALRSCVLDAPALGARLEP